MEVMANSKVYIVCPANKYSGGPTLLHQLGARLRADCVDVYMHYVPDHAEVKVHPGYRRYNLPLTRKIEYAPENILIVPEGLFICMPDNPDIQRVLWWLSVDNWLDAVRQYIELYCQENSSLDAEKLCNFWPFADKELTHWVQSEYARRFLQINGVAAENITQVEDYLDEVFLARNKVLHKAGRQDIVAFNPRKGWAFTRQLMEQSMDLAWRPVENMTPEQVEEFLRTAKVYVDFGNHPGKDRIPREAVMAGCCLITSRRGAAANPVDIPIPEDLKFADTEENIPAIVEKIRYLLANYEQETERLADYRQRILQEPEEFSQQVRAALGYMVKVEPSEIVMSHEMGGGTEVFLQEYLQSNPGRKKIVMRPPQELQGKAAWERFIRENNIGYITVNHLLGFSLKDELEVFPQLSIPYSFYLHDYLCLCPNWSLDCCAVHCGEYRTHSYCRDIFQQRDALDLDLDFYRQQFEKFLMGADKVIAPTHYAAGIVNSMYPQVKITVQPHRLRENIQRTFQQGFVQQEELTLTFLGTFSAQKGARYILRLNEWIRKRQLPVRLVVMGGDVGDIAGSREGIMFTGPYQREMIPELLAKYQTAVVLIPSAFPETYCYTASEAILAGYPVLTTNWGAQALRVQQADCGWIINRDTPDRGQLAMQKLIRRFLNPQGREEIVAKAGNTQNFHNGME